MNDELDQALVAARAELDQLQAGIKETESRYERLMKRLQDELQAIKEAKDA